MAPTTATSTPGSLGEISRRPRIDGQAAGAERQRGRVGLVQAADEPAHRADEVLGVDGEAEQLGELGDDHRQGDPGQVADADGHREQLGDEPEPGQAAGQHDRSDDQGEQPGERDPLIGVGAGERDDRGGDQRADRRVGADDQDAAGAEQEVDDQRDQRRVQARDRRQPGELCVPHALGDEQSGEHDPGEQVAAQAGAAALGQQREPRHEPSEPCRVHGADVNASRAAGKPRDGHGPASDRGASPWPRWSYAWANQLRERPWRSIGPLRHPKHAPSRSARRNAADPKHALSRAPGVAN